ncbi:hypothetical protein M8C21_001663, partial [Ambrosia artemisiifolia]
MSEKKKRGVSKCKRKLLHPDASTVDFDEEGYAIGLNATSFMSWIGVEFKRRIPYTKVAREVDSTEFEDIWKYAKDIWKIPNDLGKAKTLSKGKDIMRHFRSTLRQKYVYKDEPSDKAKGETPFKEYDYLDRKHWESFVASVDTEEWKEKSEKARNSAKQNIDPAHVGRCGYIGLEPHVESRWNQLVSSYPHLEAIGGHPGSRKYTVSRARLNPVTKLYELGEDLISNGELRGTLKLLYLKEKQLRDEGSYHTKDVVLEVLRKGRKHTGPTQCKFSEQKTKKKKGEAVETKTGEIPGIRGMGHVSDSSYNEQLEIL